MLRKNYRHRGTPDQRGQITLQITSIGKLKRNTQV